MSETFYSEFLDKVGIKKGDIIDVSSDYASMFFYSKRLKQGFVGEILLDALCDLTGPTGTVMVRTFNWDFCHGGTFDVLNTPSQVGELGNLCMKRKDFLRTAHPIYSWMVKGKEQKRLIKMNNKTSFGADSPWRFLEDNHAKMIILGNTNDFGLTCLHYIEQELQMDYRYEKEFCAGYIDVSGNASKRCYSMYVRKLDRQVIFNKLVAIDRLCMEGAMQQSLLGGYLWVASVDYTKACALIRKDLREENLSDWVTIEPLEDK